LLLAARIIFRRDLFQIALTVEGVAGQKLRLARGRVVLRKFYVKFLKVSSFVIETS
jgi:hypothetical protein